ncbi:hypothetical protein PGT21_010995 [Puccinia graminis f. sp. tritici]|uniref:Uncharacterized protein n=1 Tax=Puccinia graminis f. sp. tritici TaxID=56615 RepID=A0A5B0LTI6_PUCGR|nr:hypothetical protein PGTUg99_022157 [Puccinia graminis f. sp. tritici]KAA1083904.1 hypothetical protein PGT21_010995 [Puccinia graminis f. sp. tritici]
MDQASILTTAWEEERGGASLFPQGRSQGGPSARYRPAAKPKPVRAEKSARPGRRGIAYCRSMDAGELGAMPCRTPTIHSHYRMGGGERRSVPVSPGTLSRRPLRCAPE